ncbi:hypothetical protein [Gemmata massiliana]|nr:hypothetical protein [Gemmata massiliana]
MSRWAQEEGPRGAPGRAVEGRTDPEAEVVRGYGSSALGGARAETPRPAERGGGELESGEGDGCAAPERTRPEGILRDAFRSAGGAFAPVYAALGRAHRAPHALGQKGVPGRRSGANGAGCGVP